MDEPTFDARLFGAVLRAFRGHLSLRDAQARVHVTHAHLGRWERGERPIPPEMVTLLDSAYRANGALIGVYESLKRDETYAAAEFARQVVGTFSGNPPSRDEDNDMERRAAIHLIAAIGSGAAIPPGSLEGVLSGIERALDSRADIDDWERVVADYGHQITRSPVGSLIPDLTSDILAVSRLLGRPHPPLVQAGLLRVSAGLSGLLALELQNTGRPRHASASWGTACRAADASGDRDLRARVYGRAAGESFWMRRSPTTVGALADRAIAIADGSPGPGLARAHAAHAYLAVERGDTTEALTALRNMTETFERCPPRDADDHQLGFRETQLRWNETYVYARTADPRATTTLEQAKALYPPGTVVPMANLSLMQAMILVTDRDIEAGLQLALSTFTTSGCGSASGTSYLAKQVLTTLPQPAHTLPTARDLHNLTTTARE